MKTMRMIFASILLLLASCSTVERSEVKKDPTKYNASDYEAIARNYFVQKDYAKCDFYLSVGQSKYKRNLNLQVLHAELLYALGHHQDAYKEFKAIIKRDPKNAVARDYLQKFARDYNL